MPVPLTRILANRPMGGPRGKEWIGRSSLAATILSMGDVSGSWNPAVVPLPELSDGGLALALRETMVARSDDFWEAGLASCWEVAACQEDSPYVPGVGVFVDPHPPCLLCEPCSTGGHWRCLEAEIRRWAPGWISRETIVPPWTVGRGVVDLSHKAGVRANLFLEPLSRVGHALRGALSPRPRRVAVLGADLPGVMAGFGLERLVPDSVRCLVDGLESRLLDARSYGYHFAETRADSVVHALGGAPDLVFVAGRGSLQKAVELCAPGGTVLLLAPPLVDPAGLDLVGIWRHGIRILSGIGRSPDDLVRAREWIEDLSDRLETIPLREIPFERGGEARALLDADPNLLGVVLKA